MSLDDCDGGGGGGATFSLNSLLKSFLFIFFQIGDHQLRRFSFCSKK
jgi:hypothetical protein